MTEPLTEAEIAEIEQWPEVEHDTPIMRLIATIRSLRAENEGGQSLSRSLSTRLNEVKAENERLRGALNQLGDRVAGAPIDLPCGCYIVPSGFMPCQKHLPTHGERG